jgi:hypothetical protein
MAGSGSGEEECEEECECSWLRVVAGPRDVRGAGGAGLVPMNGTRRLLVSFFGSSSMFVMLIFCDMHTHCRHIER